MSVETIPLKSLETYLVSVASTLGKKLEDGDVAVYFEVLRALKISPQKIRETLALVARTYDRFPTPGALAELAKSLKSVEHGDVWWIIRRQVHGYDHPVEFTIATHGAPPRLRPGETLIERASFTKREPNAAFEPEPHDCSPEVAVLREEYQKPLRERDVEKNKLVGPARTLLAKLNSYEALHVKCAGEIHPVCPVCGERSEKPVTNGFILKLMELHAAETREWSPLHKGLLLCPHCAQESEKP